jgi:lytic murein transglycosylase
MTRSALCLSALALVIAAALPLPAAALPNDTCKNTESFGEWLEGFKSRAAAAGVSQGTISAAFAGITQDPTIIRKDRAQGVFKQSFEQFSGRMIPPRLAKARGLMNSQAATLVRIEQQIGVPGALVIAIWGLESDFGAARQNLSTIRSLATLAHDCRRSAFFEGQLIDALRVLQGGDLSLAEMRGGWAGELGQTQFLPSAYFNYAMDFDGNGKRDLIRSSADVLASTANFLKGHGWQKGQPWGPGTANFNVIKEWNKSEVYARTVAAFAEKLAAGDGA